MGKEYIDAPAGPPIYEITEQLIPAKVPVIVDSNTTFSGETGGIVIQGKVLFEYGERVKKSRAALNKSSSITEIVLKPGSDTDGVLKISRNGLHDIELPYMVFATDNINKFILTFFQKKNDNTGDFLVSSCFLSKGNKDGQTITFTGIREDHGMENLSLELQFDWE